MDKRYLAVSSRIIVDGASDMTMTLVMINEKAVVMLRLREHI